jgi:hypothetical protein
VAATPIVTPVTAAAVTTNPYAAYYDERGVPTTPVVSVTTVPRGESREGLEYYGTSLGTTGLGTTTAAAATMQPRAELAARETLRQETEQQMMQAERIELAQMGGGPSTMATGGQQYAAQQQQHLEKERDQKMTSSEIRQAQPVQIPIMGAGAFD